MYGQVREKGPPVHACPDAANHNPFESERGDCQASSIHKEAGHEGNQEAKDAHICGRPFEEAEAVRAQYCLHIELCTWLSKNARRGRIPLV